MNNVAKHSLANRSKSSLGVKVRLLNLRSKTTGKDSLKRRL